MPQAQPLLLFLHIPKTAGVSVTDYISRAYRPEQTFSVTGPDYDAAERSLVEKPAAEKCKIEFICGHFAYGLHQQMGSRPYEYFTVLRDPVDRMLSLYHYIRTTPAHPLNDEVVRRRLDILGFAKSGLWPEIDNCQTRILSGRPRTHWKYGTHSCDDVDLDRAIAHLEDGRVTVGLYEHLAKSLCLLDSKTGRASSIVRRKNTTRERTTVESLDPAEREELSSLSRYDLELYRRAREIFAAQWQALPMLRRARCLLGARSAQR